MANNSAPVDFLSLLPESLSLLVVSFLQKKDFEVCKLVCKNWHMLHFKAIQSLELGKLRRIQLKDFENAIASFPNLSSISIQHHGLNLFYGDFNLSSALASCSGLNNLHIHSSIEFSPLILSSIFSNCLNINTLSLVDKYSQDLPDSISKLSKLQNLSLSMRINSSLPLSSTQINNLKSLSIRFEGDLKHFSNLNCRGNFLHFFRLGNASKWQSLKKLELINVIISKEILKYCFLSIPNLELLRLFLAAPHPDRLTTLDLGNLPSLQCLQLIQWSYLIDLSPGIFKFPKLKRLRLENCPCELVIPDQFFNEIQLESLEIFSFNNYFFNEFRVLPFEKMPQLKVLRLKWYSLHFTPDFLSDLTSLEVLELDDAFPIDCLCFSENISRLQKLKSFKIYHKFSIFPYSFGNLTNLNSLDLSTQMNVEVFDWLSNFSSLKALVLNCTSMDQFPDSVGDLIHLQNLKLYDGHFVKRFPDSMVNLKVLNSLHLEFFPLVHSISFIQSLPLLNRLFVSNFSKLKELPAGFFDFKFLHKVTVLNCPELSSYETRLNGLCRCYLKWIC